MRLGANAKVGIHPLTLSGVFGIAIDICRGPCYRRLSSKSRASAQIRFIFRVAIELAIMSALSLWLPMYGDEQAVQNAAPAWGHKDGLPYKG